MTVGTLYVVGTPIGNLGDLSPRAVETLCAVDWVAAEDTRSAAVLLRHAGVQAKVRSYHDHNKEKMTPLMIRDLLQGLDIALISEAGTPGISDPGFFVVREARRQDIPVRSVPGPSAAIAALSISGMPTDRFLFAGFPPRGKRMLDWLHEQTASDATVVLYESPRRLVTLLTVIAEELPTSVVGVAREVTKYYEDYQWGLAKDLVAHFEEHADQLRGEVTVLVAPSTFGFTDESEEIPDRDPELEDLSPVVTEQMQLLVAHGYRPTEAAKIVARGHELPRNRVYAAFQASKEG